jgi:hypothetical protein
VAGELCTGLGVLDGAFGGGVLPREPPGECAGFGAGPLPGCPPPLPRWPRPRCDRCLPPPARAAEGGGMKKPGRPGYPDAQCALPPVVTRDRIPGSTNGRPKALRPGVLVADSPVAGDVSEPNSTPSGNDDPPARSASATTMAAGTTSAPRHATSGQAARRGFLGARARGGRPFGGGVGGDGVGRAATGHPSGRVTWLACGRVSTAARAGGTAAMTAEAAGTRSGGTRTARPAGPGMTRSGRVTRGTVRRDCMTAPHCVTGRPAPSRRGPPSVRGILDPRVRPQRLIHGRKEI